MPRIFKSNDFVISDEVFTIADDDWEEEGDLSQAPLLDEDAFSELFVEDTRLGDATAKKTRTPASRESADAIIQKAREEAALIVNQANLQAKLDHDQVMQQAAAEIEVLRQQSFAKAYEQGKLEGTLAAAEEIKACIAEVEQAISKMEGDLAGFMAEFDYNLKWLAWEIASKVLGRKIEKDETELLSLVKAAVASVKNEKWITVEVSDKMTQLIERLKQEFKKSDEAVEVRGISAEEGTCIIDTPGGLIDASVYSQMENLKQYFAQEQAE